jgi:hypothetical protein
VISRAARLVVRMAADRIRVRVSKNTSRDPTFPRVELVPQPHSTALRYVRLVCKTHATHQISQDVVAGLLVASDVSFKVLQTPNRMRMI